MEKITYTNTMPYSYDPAHRGAHYLIGGSYKNHGEFLESVAKFHRGLDYMVNPSTSYDTGSDIESLNASVKSSEASLACIYGNTKEQIIDTYFANVHSTLWIFMVDNGEDITEYHLNASEFRDMLDNFSTLKKSSNGLIKVRMNKASAKMISWLEGRI